MFSGIGGLDLGLEWGIKNAETVWQIEMEPFGRSILERHWPDASREVTDVREGNAGNLAPVDLISGGFPCQDISVAGNQKGFDGEKSSLWFEMSRIIGVLRPRFIVLENVAAVVSPNMRFVMARVLSDIRAHGYNAEWKIISAAQCGAPHLRRRFFLIGWLPNVANGDTTTMRGKRQNVPRESDRGRDDRSRSGDNTKREESIYRTGIDPCDDVANAGSAQRERSSTTAKRMEPKRSRATRSREQIGRADHFNFEPPVGRVVNGLSKRLSRRNRHALRALGNAVVPQCAELVGRRVQEIREILDNE
jgi:DNA (cytosine-5)-methyltransferase 1